MDALLDDLRATRPLGDAAVMAAGDPERQAAAERERDGIPLARAVVEDIRHVAAAAGAEFLL
jgi:LDH2 family malate/lactate/ureidoglycolate dehydrogenase